MKFEIPLQEAVFLKRYKRFFADIRLGDEIVTAHVPNTGSLKGCIESERPCLISVTDDPKRKLKHTLHMLKAPGSWVGVNTGLPSKLVWELWQSQKFKPWQGYDSAQMEVKISNDSRIDMILWNSQNSFAQNEKLALKHVQQTEKPLHFIEIKNVTLAEGEKALFPDCVSTRAQKHVRELMHLVEQGHTAEFVFVIQREDCTHFQPAHQYDPAYGKILAEAHKLGVGITPLVCKLSPDSLELLAEALPFSL